MSATWIQTKEPKLEWIPVERELPGGSGIVLIWAVVNIGSPHETVAPAFVKYEPEMPALWFDMYGDAINDVIRVIKWCKITN